MARLPRGSADTLRGALESPLKRLRGAAVAEIRAALRRSKTRSEAAERLGIGVRTLERIRADFPADFGEF